ncbi:MAG: PIG-L deacetylase family protein [Planctomycetota bacterium]
MRTFDPGVWPGRRVLLVAPHQDDEAFGCGGLAYLLGRAGAEVQVVVMARGDGGVDGSSATETREAESRRACELLLIKAPAFQRTTSRELREQPEAAGRQLRHDLGGRPWDLLLVPSPLERHPTHRATLLAALLSGIGGPQAELWGYGVWDSIPAVAETIEVDITAARSAKALAMSSYASQNAGRALAAAIAARDLSQALLSQITGAEPRKAVERLLDLSRLKQAATAAGGQLSSVDAAQLVHAWLESAAKGWWLELWGSGSMQGHAQSRDA